MIANYIKIFQEVKIRLVEYRKNYSKMWKKDSKQTEWTVLDYSVRFQSLDDDYKSSWKDLEFSQNCQQRRCLSFSLLLLTLLMQALSYFLIIVILVMYLLQWKAWKTLISCLLLVGALASFHCNVFWKKVCYA